MTFTTHSVTVPDGRLTVGEWAGGDRPVLAIHGLSSSHKLWLWTAAHLEGCRLVAPDLRGRGASQGLKPHHGIEVHRDDMVAILDHFGIEKTTVVGMSLGGFIAVRLAASHPERVERLLLVDGGVPFMNTAAMRAMTREQVAGVFRDRFGRIERSWPSLEEYRDFFVSATGPLLKKDDPLLEDYLRYDLVGSAPELKVRLDAAAMTDDALDLFLDDRAERAADSIQAPTHMLFAEWATGAGTPPAYRADYLEPWAKKIPSFQATLLPGTDHAATVMQPSSGAAIAGEINALATL